MKIRIPSGDAFLDVSRIVRHRIDTDVLQDDRRTASLDDAEENIVGLGPLEGDVETKTVAIKRQRGGDVFDDEEGGNAGDFCLCHEPLTFDQRLLTFATVD